MFVIVHRRLMDTYRRERIGQIGFSNAAVKAGSKFLVILMQKLSPFGWKGYVNFPLGFSAVSGLLPSLQSLQLEVSFLDKQVDKATVCEIIRSHWQSHPQLKESLHSVKSEMKASYPNASKKWRKQKRKGEGNCETGNRTTEKKSLRAVHSECQKLCVQIISLAKGDKRLPRPELREGQRKEAG